MGLLDDLKMVTGVGLDPHEAYRRAFEKGVLLGADKFDDASDMFKTAAEKLRSVDAGLAQRAAANASIYGFLATRDPGVAHEAVRLLQGMTEIEVPGTADEVMEAGKLASELQARLLESRAQAASGSEAAKHYREAANAWLSMRRQRPVTLALTGDHEHGEDGLTRFFFDAALAEVAEAGALAADDPDEAAERYAVAALAFGRCGAGQRRQVARDELRRIGLERPCWFCGRQVRGLGTNLQILPTVSSAYFHRLDQMDRDRGQSYDPGGSIYACTACATAVDNVARQHADAVRRELEENVRDLRSELSRLESRLRDVESDSHTHSGGT